MLHVAGGDQAGRPGRRRQPPRRAFMLMQSSLKKRCCAAQYGFHTSREVVPVSSPASSSRARRSCAGAARLHAPPLPFNADSTHRGDCMQIPHGCPACLHAQQPMARSSRCGGWRMCPSRWRAGVRPAHLPELGRGVVARRLLGVQVAAQRHELGLPARARVG